MTDQVDTVPVVLARFTTAAAALQIERSAEPVDLRTTVTETWVSSDHHGRIPCIGLDSGAMPGTRPDTAVSWGVVD